MGGSGGGGNRPPSDQIRDRIEEARRLEAEKLDGDINECLSELLATYNARNAKLIQRRLDQIQESLSDDLAIENILFGGSVSKHTFVNGISDVDALLCVQAEQGTPPSPTALLGELAERLSDSVEKAHVSAGQLAVTLLYSDGMEIQLLPSLRKRDATFIPSSEGPGWAEIDATAFSEKLTAANKTLNGGLVPAIKLLKSLNDGFDENLKLSGYHIEALAVGAASNYAGPTTPKALLLHLIDSASKNVLRPIKDVTGQSGSIDEYLGVAGSADRAKISSHLKNLEKYLAASPSVSRWRRVFDET